jgi:hypothetical protein
MTLHRQPACTVVIGRLSASAGILDSTGLPHTGWRGLTGSGDAPGAGRSSVYASLVLLRNTKDCTDATK